MSRSIAQFPCIFKAAWGRFRAAFFICLDKEKGRPGYGSAFCLLRPFKLIPLRCANIGKLHARRGFAKNRNVWGAAEPCLFVLTSYQKGPVLSRPKLNDVMRIVYPTIDDLTKKRWSDKPVQSGAEIGPLVECIGSPAMLGHRQGADSTPKNAMRRTRQSRREKSRSSATPSAHTDWMDVSVTNSKPRGRSASGSTSRLNYGESHRWSRFPRPWLLGNVRFLGLTLPSGTTQTQPMIIGTASRKSSVFRRNIRKNTRKSQ